jgi:hypothetical protein
MARTLDTTAALDGVRRLAARAWSQPETLGDGDCEDLRGDILGQPVNTITSVGYVAVGAWLLERTRRLPRDQRTAAAFYGAFVALSGAGSVAYHGPQFAGAQLFHDLPIAGMLGLGIGVPVARRLGGRPVLPGGVVRGVWVAAGFAAVGGLAFLAGRTDSPACDPESLLQLHGLWHLCTAVAAGAWATAVWPAAAAAPAGDPPAGHPRSRVEGDEQGDQQGDQRVG